MRGGFRVLSGLALIVALAGAAHLGMTSEAVAKGKPQPPPCDCPETIELPNGDVCVLVACGSDCVYSCPFPFYFLERTNIGAGIAD